LALGEPPEAGMLPDPHKTFVYNYFDSSRIIGCSSNTHTNAIINRNSIKIQLKLIPVYDITIYQ